jgi:ATP-dependent RNA helicase SUPV3L1/SUV3
LASRATPIPFDAELVEQVENHRYDPVKVLQWRNSALDSPRCEALLASPGRAAAGARSREGAPASDHFTLQTLAHDEEIRAHAGALRRCACLWQSVSSFRLSQTDADEHSRLVGQIFRT